MSTKTMCGVRYWWKRFEGGGRGEVLGKVRSGLCAAIDRLERRHALGHGGCSIVSHERTAFPRYAAYRNPVFGL
jgi:hypothetical protein